MISLFIALLGYVLRLGREEMGASLAMPVASFVNAYLSWWLIQYVIRWQRPVNYGWKAALAIGGCMLISFLLFTLNSRFTGVRDRFELLTRGRQLISLLLLGRGLVIGGFLYYIAYLLSMSAQSQQSSLENEQLKKENLQARLSLLQEQVSPHFLFNSLGTLRSMVQEKAPREFIQRLSEVYRYLLSNRMADLVELQSELDFTEAYLHILQERFEAAIVTEIHVEDKLRSRKLPTATLQLLIENAVKHNVVTIEDPLNIFIYTVENKWLVVSNSLKRRNKVSDSLGNGLSNIQERYRLLAGLDIGIAETDKLFTVRVPLLI